MNFISAFMAFFSVLGAVDRITGGRLGLAREFERGVLLLGTMALSMIGMIVLSPGLAQLLSPVFRMLEEVLHLEPSILPAALFANDMGGASLSVEVASDRALGMFNALVVSSMMGCTISFTLPYALGCVKPERHKSMFLGFLCGIVTLPLGCVLSGVLLGLPVGLLLADLLPLVLFSAVIAGGLLLRPMVCIRLFALLGQLIKIMITVGLCLALLKFLTGLEPIPGLATLEEGAAICLNACAVMTGAFPMLHLLSKVTRAPLKKLGEKLEINEISALGFVSSLATNVTTFEMMNEMDDKGVVLNAAFSVSASFVFAGHLAFTLAFQPDYVLPVILGKLFSGAAALTAATLFYKRVAGSRVKV